MCTDLVSKCSDSFLKFEAVGNLSICRQCIVMLVVTDWEMVVRYFKYKY